MNRTGKHQLKSQKAVKASRPLRIGLLLLAVVLMFNGYSLAKYFMEENKKSLVVAKNFYFESDLLALETTPSYTLQAGVDDITFSLMNYPDELRASEVGIKYTVTLSKDGSEKGRQTGTIASGRNKADISFNGLADGTYTVIAEATSPYTQSLSAKFTIVPYDYGLYCTVSDSAGSPNLKVTVSTTDYSGNITISWPDGVLPDNTDDLLRNAVGNSCTVYVNQQSEYTFQFFKNNPGADYSGSITVNKA